MIIYRCDVCNSVSGEIAKLTAPNLNLDICYNCQIEIPNILTGNFPFYCFVCKFHTKIETTMINHIESKKHNLKHTNWKRYEKE